MSEVLETARNVIAIEQDGLKKMAVSLDGNFEKSVQILSRIKGHIVVTGMGKPGHIAKKISATLASTGTKSFFMHPGEASHGDLGMLSIDDAVLAFSLSGNTSELIPMLEYSKRFGIPIIAITGNVDSVLAKTASAVILMPEVAEATPNNLAPTTSSTMMLAVGDAIAVCLLKMKNFGKEDFRRLHPGGSLGKKLLKVSDLMHSEIPVIQSTDSMSEAILEMTAKAFGCVGVLDNQRLIGIITDGDLRRHISDDLLHKTARDVMTAEPKVVPESMFAVEATRILNESKITSLFVVDSSSDKLLGILHIHDCLRAGLC